MKNRKKLIDLGEVKKKERKKRKGEFQSKVTRTKEEVYSALRCRRENAGNGAGQPRQSGLIRQKKL